MNVHRLVPRLLVVAALAAAVVWAGFHREQLDPAALDAWLTGLGHGGLKVWAPAVHIAVFAAGTVAFVPGTVFALAGGALFGPVWGTVFNLIGATVGAAIAFLVARYLAGDWVAKKAGGQEAGGRVKQMIAGVEAEGWRFVAFVRLVPLFPFNLANYAFGLTRIGFGPYLAASLVCMAPGTIAYAWLGYSGRAAIAGDVSAVRYGLLGLGLLAAIVFLPRLIRRWRRPASGTIEAEALAEKLKTGAALTLIDVRGPDEFAGPLGHIPGARNIPLADLPRRLGEIDCARTGEIAVICLTDRRSAAAAALLRKRGFAAVTVLRGGMRRWTALGLETASGAT